MEVSRNALAAIEAIDRVLQESATSFSVSSKPAPFLTYEANGVRRATTSTQTEETNQQSRSCQTDVERRAVGSQCTVVSTSRETQATDLEQADAARALASQAESCADALTLVFSDLLSRLNLLDEYTSVLDRMQCDVDGLRCTIAQRKASQSKSKEIDALRGIEIEETAGRGHVEREERDGYCSIALQRCASAEGAANAERCRRNGSVPEANVQRSVDDREIQGTAAKLRLSGYEEEDSELTELLHECWDALEEV